MIKHCNKSQLKWVNFQNIQFASNYRMRIGSNSSLRFVIATDVHLGHKENEPERQNDSFNAFEEVLSIAAEQNADFLLLGGDLFDQVNPSQRTIYKCLGLLRDYVQGQSHKNLKASLYDNESYRINFQNRDVNIKLPVFTIHGNHDYPNNDFGCLSICDLLHVSGYANYFGKHTDLSQIVIKPMIIEKQGLAIKVAVYGLGYIKDGALNELFENKKVKFVELENRENYFCLFIFHQNRYKKGMRAGAPALKCVSSKHIPVWMDLTIWGHEHEAIPKIQVEDDRSIFQPGSTIITSFIEAEAYTKQCLLIDISQKSIQIKPTPLIKSYRPMICKNYEIAQLHAQNGQNFDIYNYFDNQMAAIIKEVQDEYPGRKPIIRLKIQYSGYNISRCKILQTKYANFVANPESIISFWKRKKQIGNIEKDDKKLFQAFKSKGQINVGYKEITEEILQKYITLQQNQNLYYDPRELYKYHQNSISKQNSKGSLTECLSRKLQKNMEPNIKQIQTFYRNMQNDIETVAKAKIASIRKNLNVDINWDKEEAIKEIVNEQVKQTPIHQNWQQYRRMISIKSNQLQNQNLLKNFGQDFFGQKSKQKRNSQSNTSNQRQQNRFTVSNKNRIGLDESSYEQSESMQIEEQFSMKPKPRPGILKKNQTQSSEDEYLPHADQQDCCKRAEKTPYDQKQTKYNFEQANKVIKVNLDKNNKKNAKKVEEKEKKKKSVKWSDEQGEI